MTPANGLTLSRIALAFLFMSSLFREGAVSRLLSLFLFLVASLTDLYDGKLPRLRDEVSNFGRLMDPIADKILVISAFVAFVQLGLIPTWMVVLVMSRELLITGIRILVLTQGQILESAPVGKHKTATQMGGILWVLGILVVRELPTVWWPQGISRFYLDAVLEFSIFWVMFVVVWVTVSSGLLYLFRHRLLLTGSGP